MFCEFFLFSCPENTESPEFLRSRPWTLFLQLVRCSKEKHFVKQPFLTDSIQSQNIRGSWWKQDVKWSFPQAQLINRWTGSELDGKLWWRWSPSHTCSNLSIFSTSTSRSSVIEAILHVCVHLLIDSWLQSHSGLLKYQSRASGFPHRPWAPLLSV